MKIGILTLPFNNNYGGYLQCYALLSVLQQMGHSVEIIRRIHNKRPLKKRALSLIKNLIRYLSGQKVYIIIPNQMKEFQYKGQQMMPFVEKFLQPISIPLDNSQAFYAYVKNRFDAIFVGSDQVWRPEYGPCIQDYFLCGVKDPDLKRVSYAASFGTSNPMFTDQELSDCGKAISLFKAVSVREQSGLDVFDRFEWEIPDATVVLDPTMLLSKDDYLRLLSSKTSIAEGKIFSYILDSNYETQSVLQQISALTDLRVYNIIDSVMWKKYSYQMPSIEDWLAGIRDCELVVTDSFHGTVFSIIMNKPFYVCVNSSRGSDRFETLLGLFGLKNRMVFSSQKNIDLLKPIDWLPVNLKLKEEVLKSKDFISNCLK